MDVWKIGVAISLTNGMSPVLAVIAADLLGLKGKVGEVEKAFSSWNTALAGTLSIVAGGALIAGVAKLIDHGQELVHVQQQLATAGVDQVDVAKATADSWKVAAQYGLKVSDVLADIKEARMVFGSTEHAMEFIEPLEKMRVVLNSVSEGTGTKASDAVYEAARAGELKGLQNPGDFVRYFDEMTKAVSASGGKVEPKSFLQATQYGRLASKGWDEQFYTRILPSLIQEMGPSQSGTALMSLFGTLVQGKVSKRSVGMMEDIGLIGDPTKIIYNKLGDPVGMNPGAIQGTDLMTRDPYKWSQEILRPLVDKKLGYDAKPGDEGAIQLLGGLFGNRTAAQAIATMMLESQRINKDAGLIGQAKGMDAAPDLLKNDPTAVMNNFKNSWDNLMTAFGSPLVPVGIQAMNSLAETMKALTSFAVAHPEAVKLIGEAIIGIGLALIGLGGAAIIAAAAAIVGPVTAAVTAIGVVIATIAAFNWKGVSDVLNGIMNAISSFIEGIKGLMPSENTWKHFFFGKGADGQSLKDSLGLDVEKYMHKSNYVPPANNNTPQPIHTAVNIDGRTIARAVSYHMAANSPGNTGSTSFDGRSMWAPTDVSSI